MVDGSLSRCSIQIAITNDIGEKVFFDYQLDSIVLYENGTIDEKRRIEIELITKQSKSDLGLAQEESASRSVTTKY